ncbi:tripartite tricarboxylate transporter substrate binding protein [Verminephrobacter eiseniae]|nr:tripartite tricarboxylate transporter substrate binding protein [Verminephrobacter eiseniae]MCW5294217.1 tripartite tricarboxylate transporter substrate binding protein [Verminephrobacter eiseniae]MCW8183631.1 tripartite tricarboxylate transporter substrate binding protein [Verminephrobacter eiseniae]MCW8222004.1 tripartite tricarboxylate transporter substrate binding protein [Verminephrobacter eiseniae]
MMKISLCGALIAAMALPPLALAVAAQPVYPSRPITMIVPFSAGGGTDSIARDMARNMADRLGQPVVIDNRGGAGGAIGADMVAKAKPDGYTLLFATSSFATNAAITVDLPYDAVKSFTPVAMIGRGPLLVVASPQLGVKRMADVIAVAKTRPGGLNFCSAGNGSINHLAGEMLRQKAGLQMTHVPFKGSSPATVELLSGRVDLFFSTVPTILPFVRDGKLPVLAVTSAQRSPLFPGVPTMAEAGIASFDVSTWWGVLAPAKTPAAIVEALHRAINDAAAAEPVKGRLVSEGADPVQLTPAAFGQELGKELALWRAVASHLGMPLR